MFGNGKTSLRGGGALLYDTETLGALLQGIVQQAPLANSYGLGVTSIATLPVSLNNLAVGSSLTPCLLARPSRR